MIGPFGLGGERADDPGNPTWIVPATALDVPVVPGPLSKDHAEDLQATDFLRVLALQSSRHPLGIRAPESDPPDRVLTASDTEWNLELTELTVQDVREDIGIARTIGRRLQERLRAENRFRHLEGRQVALSYLPESGQLPKDPAKTVEPVAEVLAEDKGCVGDGLDVSHGLPENLGPDPAGFYGSHGPFVIQVYPDGMAGEITVSASAQGDTDRRRALALLQERIDEKDLTPNELLLFTCALPDRQGYMCGLDPFMFMTVAEAIEQGQATFAANHLTAVVLHLWNTPQFIELYRRDGSDVPWHTP